MNTKKYTLPTYQAGSISIYELGDISRTGINDILRMLDGNGTYADTVGEKQNNAILFECDDIFLVECESFQDIEKIKAFWERNFTKKTDFASELIDGREIPQYSGYFERNGKYYLLGALHYSPNKRNLNPTEGSYNGILWNPNTEAQNSMNGTVQDTSGKTDNILGQNGNIEYRNKKISFKTYKNYLLPISTYSHYLKSIDLDNGEIFELGRMLLLKIKKEHVSIFKDEMDKLYDRSIEGVPKLRPKKIAEKYQVPEILGGFDYGDYEYLVLYTCFPLTDETVPERGIYRGVIVKPALYFSDSHIAESS